MIVVKEMRDELKDTRKGSSREFPQGWWVSVNSNDIYNVSSDLGPGDHMGYVWSIDNGSKLGLNEEEKSAINVAYATNWSFEIQYDLDGDLDDSQWWVGDNELELKYLELIPSKSPSEWRKLFDNAINKLHKNYIRVLYNKRNKSLSAQVYSLSKKYYDRFMEFFLEFIESYPVESVYVEDYFSNLIWKNYSLYDVLDSNEF